MVIDAERALRDQGKSHTLGPRKVRLSEEDLQEPKEDSEGSVESFESLIVRQVLAVMELRPDDDELRDLLGLILDACVERGAGE